MFVSDQNPVRGEEELVPDRLEPQVDLLLLQEKARTVFSQFLNRLLNVQWFSIVEVHLDDLV